MLAYAIGISALVHVAVLAVRFVDPDSGLLREAESRLDITLVNAKSAAAPTNPDVLAQANLDGGGNNEYGRRSSPLPNSFVLVDGDRLESARRNVEQLEQEQLRLLRSLTDGELAPPVPAKETRPVQPNSGSADEDGQRLMRMEAEISQSISDYQKRPKRTVLMPSAMEYRFARYFEDWRARVERIGNEHYPEEARGKIYGELLMSVTIRKDGSLVDAVIEQSSGSPVLDRAARRIVKLAAPFPPFPPEIARDTEELVIPRTWIFTNEKFSTRPAQAPAGANAGAAAGVAPRPGNPD
ncbi:MAG TPA: TonB family protein [Burkholderiaceae bacterium]|nr:TonB family protein [Burkholderiaceae bacterium]